MEEIIEENKRLKERIKTLEEIISRGTSGSSSAYSAIRAMIVEKVSKEFNVLQFEEWQRKHKRSVMERQIMDDLKWDLRVRTINDFRTEHIEKAKEYIDNYMIPEKI